MKNKIKFLLKALDINKAAMLIRSGKKKKTDVVYLTFTVLLGHITLNVLGPIPKEIQAYWIILTIYTDNTLFRKVYRAYTLICRKIHVDAVSLGKFIRIYKQYHHIYF